MEGGFWMGEVVLRSVRLRLWLRVRGLLLEESDVELMFVHRYPRYIRLLDIDSFFRAFRDDLVLVRRLVEVR